jgi:hypothetical protein
MFCEHAPVDRTQEVQLRTWAEALCDAAESDRRAMGKAILMLLDQIESLRAELEHQIPDVQPPEPAQQPEHDAANEDTAPISLRDRFRAATHRGDD